MNLQTAIDNRGYLYEDFSETYYSDRLPKYVLDFPLRYIAMAVNFNENMEQDVEDNSRRYLAFEYRENLQKKLEYDGIHIVSGAALAAYTWKTNYHPVSTFMFSTIGAAGVVGLCANMKKRYRRMANYRREIIGLPWYLTTGLTSYSVSVYAFSEGLKREDEMWLPCLIIAAHAYCQAVTTVNSLGSTVLNRRPYLKCGQVIFGRMLTACAAYYLLSYQQHEEPLLFTLPLTASAIAANHILFTGYRRVDNTHEPNWFLFQGIELLLGGCIMCINSSIIFIYGINHEFDILINAFYCTGILNGLTDISSSMVILHACSELEKPVFNGICGMIVGPVIFLSSCLGVKCIENPVLMTSFFFPAGMGLALLGKSLMDLFDLLPRRLFYRYARRVLGPMMTVWGSFFAAYAGYHLGWKFSLIAAPLIPIGMFATYRGYTNIDEPE